MIVIRKILLSFLMSIITVMSISFVDIDCSKAVFYFIKTWLVVSPSQDLVVHKTTVLSSLILNIFVVGFIYFLLLFKVKNIKNRYLITLFPIAFLALAHFAFYSQWNGNYIFFDNNNVLSLQTQTTRNEPLMTGKISLFFEYPRFNHEQCQPFN